MNPTSKPELKEQEKEEPKEPTDKWTLKPTIRQGKAFDQMVSAHEMTFQQNISRAAVIEQLVYAGNAARAFLGLKEIPLHPVKAFKEWKSKAVLETAKDIALGSILRYRSEDYITDNDELLPIRLRLVQEARDRLVEAAKLLERETKHRGG